MKAQIRGLMKKREQEGGHYKSLSHPTVFHDVLDSDLPALEKTAERLWQEAQVLCIAGTGTTAWTLSVIMFYLLADPKVLQRLRDELEKAVPDPAAPMTTKELEKLPYLVCSFRQEGSPVLISFQTAVIQEGLRLSFGVTTRLQRVCLNETLEFNDGKKIWRIPPSVSAIFVSPIHPPLPEAPIAHFL
jgi:cytochrome P450